MNSTFLLATVSLAFQITVLALLIVGFMFKQRRKLRTHGITMLAALSVHLVIIAVIMVPSFAVGLLPKIVDKADPVGLFSLFHVAVGASAVILATWIVGAWRLRQSTAFCAPKKKLMKYTLALWLVSLSLGIALYFILNWSFLFG